MKRFSVKLKNMHAQTTYKQKAFDNNMNEREGYLLLADGTKFEGLTFGKSGKSFGEICLFTGMTGYQEAFTDPSYTNQIILMSNAHIGNYGFKSVIESERLDNVVQVAGVVCRNYSHRFSRAESDSLDKLLENTVTIYDIDTRAVVRHLRQHGNMNAAVVSDGSDPKMVLAELESRPKMSGLNLAEKVESIKDIALYNHKPGAKYTVGLLDFGCKENIRQELIQRDCNVIVYRANELPKSFDLDGYLLSNGPGDPASMKDAIQAIKQLVDSGKPVFGICLGHQLLALSQGLKTYKMKNGHRGGNHAVVNLRTGKAEVTSQNHGFAVENFERSDIEITHLNLNDQTIEGIALKNRPAFSVQHHPEACAGPHDSAYLFDQFVSLMEKEKYERK